MGMTPQHFHTYHSYILCHFATTYTNVLYVCCVQGSGVGSGGCVATIF